MKPAVVAIALPILIAASLLLALACKETPVGDPPVTPGAPLGITNGGIDTSYEFRATTIDPDDDSVCFRFCWGDGDTSPWSLMVASGDTASMMHAWSDPGEYLVRAQAMDEAGLTSDWTEAHGVTIYAIPYEVVLKWRESSQDLDAHFWTPEIGSTRHHVYYLSQGRLAAAPYCSLHADIRLGPGPERTTIGTAVPGSYVYAVHCYAGDSSITTSGATVEVHANGRLLSTIRVPGEPALDRTWWHVFRLDGGTGTVTELNLLSTGPPDLIDELPVKQPNCPVAGTER